MIQHRPGTLFYALGRHIGPGYRCFLLVLVTSLAGAPDLFAQPQIVDSCFTSIPPGTSFGNSSSMTGGDADMMQWTGSDWTGDWPNADLTLPPPTGMVGCAAIFIGSGTLWTTGGEGFGMLLSQPLVAGQTYSFTFTYVSHGVGSDGAFSPQFSTGPTGGFGPNVVGYLPPAGYNWTTNTVTFTATAAQDGDLWIFLDSTGSGSSGMISSFCVDCNVPSPSCTANIGPDQNLCPGETVDLDATTTGATYVWQDGSTGAQYTV